MNKELKPCPFCGGEAQVNERYRSGKPNRKMYWVSCKACGISQQNTNVSGYRYQSKAIDRWNRRELLDKIVKQLEECSVNYCKEYGYAEDENVLYLPDAIEIVKGNCCKNGNSSECVGDVNKTSGGGAK